MDEIQKGHALNTAVATGVVDAVANYVQARVGVFPSLPTLKRVISAIGVGDMAHLASGVAKKLILNESGYTKAAQDLDPMEGLGESTITNALFGALPGHGKVTGKNGPAANGDQASGTTPSAATQSGEGETPPPPGAPDPDLAAAGVTSTTPTGAGVPPAAPSGAAPAAADTPTAEPAKDLRAQFTDMKDKKTPRQGVFLSTDNLANMETAKGADALSVRSQLNGAKKNGRTVETPNGLLIVKDAETAKAVTARLAGGEDPQSVIGSLTGAGAGKTEDMTAVVQGHDENGAVATESAVKPEDVPMAAQKVVDQGKTPVVTTPEDALARRDQEIQNEQQATPAEPTPAAQEDSAASSNAEQTRKGHGGSGPYRRGRRRG